MNTGTHRDQRVARFDAPSDGAGLRLDRALAQAWPDLSRSRIQRLIREGLVEAAGATITDPSYRVKPGQSFTATVPAPESAVLEPQAIALNVLYEDDDLLVIDKPAGMVVHPGPGRNDRTLVNALLAHCGPSLAGVGGVRRPGIVHRLDKDTSGLIVVAKNDATHIDLIRQFQARTVERRYLAVIWGVPMPPVGEIEANIGRDPRHRKRMAVVPAPHGRPALTRYKVLRRRDEAASLIECRLKTGRTHQIRVHMAHCGHAIIGDPQYGRTSAARLRRLDRTGQRAVQGFDRQALHAATLGFVHPRRGERLSFTSEPPQDMKSLIYCLKLA